MLAMSNSQDKSHQGMVIGVVIVASNSAHVYACDRSSVTGAGAHGQVSYLTLNSGGSSYTKILGPLELGL